MKNLITLIFCCWLVNLYSQSNSFLFDGINDQLSSEFPVFNDLDISQEFTLEMWVKPFEIVDRMALINQYNGNRNSSNWNRRFGLEINNGKLAYYKHYFRILTSQNSIVPNTWNHIAVRRTSQGEILSLIHI